MEPAADSKMFCLSVAGLQFALDARGTVIPMAVPPTHARFLASADHVSLTLSVRDGALREVGVWRPLYTPPDTWQLWQDKQGRYVFVVGRNYSPPVRQVTVDPGFRSGEVLGPFSDLIAPYDAVYPLEGIDKMLYANWLAEFGDLILHASGVVIDGQGYAFAGVSGAGKSTLAAAFAEHPFGKLRAGSERRATHFDSTPLSLPSAQDARGFKVDLGVTVLGEDSLVLRYVNGGFRIYGTPWHADLAHYAPVDAPLAKLFFLDRTAPSGIRPCSPVDGIAQVLRTAFIPYYRPEAVAHILDTLAILAERVPFYMLSHRLGDDPLEILRNA